MKISKMKSVKAPLYHWLTLSAAICLCVSMFYLVWTAFLNDRTSAQANEKTLRNYAANLDNALQAMQSFGESLALNNVQFRTLSQSNCSPQQRVVAEHSLSELVRTQTPRYGTSLLYNADMKRAFFYCGENVQNDALFLERAALMHQVGEVISKPQINVNNRWQFFKVENHWMMILVNQYRKMYFCTILDLNCYFDLYPVLTHSQLEKTVVYTTEGNLLIAPPDLADIPFLSLLASGGGTHNSFRYKISCMELNAAPIGIALVTPRAALFEEYLPHMAFFLLVVIFLCVFLKKVLHYLDQSLLFPLQEIAGQMARLSGEDSAEELNDWGDFEEYHAIRSALNELLQKKNELETQNYTNKVQKEHALLQYYQLQTRSHFFLNCLKSLYGMAENSNRAQMQAMIISFSNHLRYIFHDNLNLVTLQDELKEVSDYHRIIALDFPQRFLLNQNVPKELFDVNVPPLVIQTFLENTYHHAVRGQGVLVFQIEVSQAVYQKKSYLRLHLWDNGKGYPQEVLESMNTKQRDTFADYHVGINNLLHRMALIYGEDYQAAFYNEEHGNAHSLLYIPLTRSGNGQSPPSAGIVEKQL